MTKKSSLFKTLGIAMAISAHHGAMAAIMVDVDSGSSSTQSGFTGVSLTDLTSGVNVGGVTFTLAQITGTFDHRNRTDPDNNGVFTYQDLYRDFVFMDDDNDAATKDATLTMSGLSANTSYNFTVYAYDNNSTASPDREARYNQGADVLFTTSFRGQNSATGVTANDEYAFTGVFTADGSGGAVIDIYQLNSGDAGIFINGFEVVAVPEPSTLALTALCGLAALMVIRRRS